MFCAQCFGTLQAHDLGSLFQGAWFEVVSKCALGHPTVSGVLSPWQTEISRAWTPVEGLCHLDQICHAMVCALCFVLSVLAPFRHMTWVHCSKEHGSRWCPSVLWVIPRSQVSFSPWHTEISRAWTPVEGLYHLDPSCPRNRNWLGSRSHINRAILDFRT